MKYPLAILAATVISGHAATVATESFGTTTQNPMSSPSTTTDLTWTYGGPGGSNSSRLFNPSGNGGGYNTHGWISIVDGSTITTTISLAGLAGDASLESGGNLFDTNVYSLTFEHCTETSVDTRISTLSVGVSSSGTIAFLSGGNEDASQAFSALSDTGTNTGGTFGSTPDRRWTMNFSGTGLTTADTVTVTLGRVTSTSGFTYFDDVGLVAIPEPSAAALLGLGGLVLLRRRRR